VLNRVSALPRNPLQYSDQLHPAALDQIAHLWMITGGEALQEHLHLGA